jgi:hypothetical protein
MVCKADTRVYTGLGLRLVCSAAARVAMHWSARSRGYKLSRKGGYPKSLFVACLPYYSSQGEDTGYICGKKVKR